MKIEKQYKEVLIQISDNDCGISNENIKKVIDLFFTSSDLGKGTGLGLSIAYSNIEKHYGNIKYKSEIGKGTKVTITLLVK